MKTVLLAILQVVLASGIFYGYYHLFLRNKRFHQYNRFYLLMATFISLLIPFLNIPVYFTPEDKASSIVWQTLSVFSSQPADSIIVTSTSRSGISFTGTDLLYCLYGLVAVIVLVKMILSLLKIRQLKRNNPGEQLDGIHFITTQEPGAPFSFFRWLFWHNDIELQSVKGEQIFRHELFHIRQKHSLDVIFMELVTIVCWINPFFHLIKKEIKAIHEFLADQFAVKKNHEWDYAELLLMQALNTNQSLVNPFFHNQIKRRIAMITSSQQPKYRYFRKILVLPLLALIAGLFAFTYKQKQEAAALQLSETILPDKIAEEEQPLNLILREISPTDTPRFKTVQDHYIIKADKVDVKLDTDPAKTKKRVPGLFIIDSKQYTEKQLEEKFGKDFTFESAEIYVTPANDPAAIKKYGEAARNGVAEFKSLKLAPIVVEGKKIDLSFPKVDLSLPPSPLIVVDEVVRVKGQPKESLNDINPNDIKEINILKDKSAIDKYGEQGKDGVIEIKTKEPKTDLKEVTVVGYGVKKVKGLELEKVVLDKEVNNYQLKEVTVVDRVFTALEVQPAFPGGDDAWRKYLERNLNSEVPSANGAPAGSYAVQVQFIVDEQGVISSLKALTNKGYGMEDEVIRTIKSGPNWKPGVQNGKVVKAYKTQPVIFVVNESTPLKEVVVSSTSKPTMLDIKQTEKLNPIYPNPTTNSVTIPYSAPAAGEGEINIFDASGKLQMTTKTSLQKGLNTLSVNMSSLIKGVYFVEISDANKNPGRRYKVVKE
jgi:beta-lactamase regulating signal transducer with metallopeptidase domain